MERRTFDGASVAIEQRDGKPPLIVGYASVFWNPSDPGTQFRLYEGAVERVLPTAFNRAIMEDDVRALYNHDTAFVLGRSKAGTLRLSVDSNGLRYEIDPPDTQAGRDVVESIRRGDVSGSSFAFKVRAQTIKKEGDGTNAVKVRELVDVALLDVGPVVYPAYSGASVGVRSDGDVAEARQAIADWCRRDGQILAHRIKAGIVSRGL